MVHPKRFGILGAEYAEARERKCHLRFRYMVRAEAAVEAYRERAREGRFPRVLDLGAADGRILLYMRDLLGGIGHFDGIELSAEAIAQAPPLPIDTRLLHGDVTRLPKELQSDNYDLCVALAVLEHLSEPLACVREAFRMLRPGGVFVATAPSPFWDTVAGALRLVPTHQHEQLLERADLIRLAREAGFADIQFRPFMWLPLSSLPYLSIFVDPRFSLAVDRLVGRVPFTGPLFVNQLVVADR